MGSGKCERSVHSRWTLRRVATYGVPVSDPRLLVTLIVSQAHLSEVVPA